MIPWTERQSREREEPQCFRSRTSVVTMAARGAKQYISGTALPYQEPLWWGGGKGETNLMAKKITLFDYNADWALKDYFTDPKPTSGYLTREEVIEFYGTLGVDGVELTHAYWGDCPIDYVKNLAENAGIPIVSYMFVVDMAWPSATERRKAVDHARSLIDRTAELGASIAMIFPGSWKEGISLEELRQWAVEGLQLCAEQAHSAGITLAMENIDYALWRPLHGSAQQCREICEFVDHPSFRLIYDACASLFLEEHPLDVLKIMAPYLVHVHLKNSRLVLPGEKLDRYRDSIGGRRLTGTVLDGGCVEIPRVLTELENLQYEGGFLVEYQGQNDPRPALKYNVEYLQRQLGILQ